MTPGPDVTVVCGSYGVESVGGARDRVRVGQTVQFHLRDAQSADEDLRELLAADGLYARMYRQQASAYT